MASMQVDQISLDYHGVWALDDENDREGHLLSLIPDLSPDLLEDALYRVTTLSYQGQASFFETAAPFLAEHKLILPAVSIAAKISDHQFAAYSVAVLANSGDKDVRELAYKRLDEYAHADTLYGLSTMVNVLDSEHLRMASELAARSENIETKIYAFQKLAPRMGTIWKQKFRESIKTLSVSPNDEFDLLIALCDEDTDEESDAFQQAEALLDSNVDAFDKAHFLSKLIHFASQEKAENLYNVLLELIYTIPYQEQLIYLVDVASVVQVFNTEIYDRMLSAVEMCDEKERVEWVFKIAENDWVQVEHFFRVFSSVEGTFSENGNRKKVARLFKRLSSQLENESNNDPGDISEMGEAQYSSVLNQASEAVDEDLSQASVAKVSNAIAHDLEIERYVVNKNDLSLSERVADIFNQAYYAELPAKIIRLNQLIKSLLEYVRSENSDSADGVTFQALSFVWEFQETFFDSLDKYDWPEPDNEVYPSEDSWEVSSTVNDVWNRAGHLASMLSGSVHVQDYHLLIALLEGNADNGVFRKLLGESGVETKQIELALLKAVNDNLEGENISAWEQMVLKESPVQKDINRIHIVAPDTTDGVDRLNLDREFHAFASVITSEKLAPPLAIGLFGDWGNGKSFFMEQIRKKIEYICENSKGQSEAFCSNVAQISFNAWHYVDSNLWASIIIRIFDGLAEHMSVSEPSAFEERRLQIIAKLERLKELERDAKRVLESAEKEENAILSKQQAARAELETSQENLQKLKNTPPINKAFLRGFLKEKGATLLKEMGLDFPDTKHEFDQLSLELKRSASLFRRLGCVSADGSINVKQTTVVSLGMSSVLGVTAAIPYLAGQSEVMMGIDKIVVALTGMAAVATPFIASILPKLESFNKKNQQLRALLDNSEVEKAISDAVAEREKLIAEQEVLLAENKERSHKLKRQYEKARDTHQQYRLSNPLDPYQLFTGFVEECAAKDDYRSQTGIIAQVRKDLEDLTDLFVAEERRTGKAYEVADNQELAGGEFYKHRIEPVDQVQRIVLYIDDLDRCPPKRVAEVLQAVHLLLAFKLFVVVVAVDPRWLHKALEAHYPEFLETRNSGEYTSRDDKRGTPSSRVTTPRAYLEKIFQIPYVVPKMEESGFKQLVRATIGYQGRVTTSQGEPSKQANNDGGTPRRKQGVKGGDFQSRNKGKLISGKPKKIAMGIDSNSEDKESFNANPHSEDFKEHEIELIEQLSPLVLTPRSAKRLINIYKLIRVTLTDSEFGYFISDNSAAGYRPTLIMLAMIIGYPEEGIAILELLRHSDERDWHTFVQSLDSQRFDYDSINPMHLDQLKRALELINSRLSEKDIPGVPQFQYHIDRVSRYSFEAAISTWNS
ncbi:P-loop NTPase fold protein [Pseudomonadota bacterium]